jgi:hypothetical protein
MVDIPPRCCDSDGVNVPGSGTPIRDILLPDSDRTALIQVIVIFTATMVATFFVRRERALALLALGIGSVILGIMGLRTLH